jgi:hypothetical protein
LCISASLWPLYVCFVAFGGSLVQGVQCVLQIGESRSNLDIENVFTCPSQLLPTLNLLQCVPAIYSLMMHPLAMHITTSLAALYPTGVLSSHCILNQLAEIPMSGKIHLFLYKKIQCNHRIIILTLKQMSYSNVKVACLIPHSRVECGQDTKYNCVWRGRGFSMDIFRWN